MSRFKIGRKRTDEAWGDSWGVEDPPTLYLEPSSDDADDGIVWTGNDDDAESRGLFISWRMLAGGTVGLLVVVAFIMGLATTHYNKSGKAVLETPAYREKMQYAKTADAIWKTDKAIMNSAYNETKNYTPKSSNPFVLSQDITKDASGLTQIQTQLLKIQAPPEYQTFQNLMDGMMTEQIKALKGESQTVVASTNPNIKTVMSALNTVVSDQTVIDKEMSDMLALYNLQ